MVTSLSKRQKAGNILDLIQMREIKDNCLISKTPKRGIVEYRAVLKVNPVNFSLMSDVEQESVLESFRVLLQRLDIGVAISIHVRVLPYVLLLTCKNYKMHKQWRLLHLCNQ